MKTIELTHGKPYLYTNYKGSKRVYFIEMVSKNVCVFKDEQELQHVILLSSLNKYITEID